MSVPTGDGFWMSNDAYNQAQADMWATGAQRQVADQWAAGAHAAAPSIVADAQDRADKAAAAQRQQVADDWARQAQQTATAALVQASHGSTQQAGPSDSPPPPAPPEPTSADPNQSAEAGTPTSVDASVSPTSPVTAPLSDPSSSQQPIQPPAQPAQPSAPAAPVTAPIANPSSPRQPVAIAPATQTTVGLSGGVSDASLSGPALQTLNLIGSTAQQYGLGQDGARAVQAIGVTEGALVPRDDRLDIGDHGNSFGWAQLYRGGQLANFAADMGMSEDQAGEYARTHPDVVAQWALSPTGTNGWTRNGYLGNAIRAGQQQGLSGADLATYAQLHGQVSVAPERAGANYNALFAGGAGMTVSATNPNPQAATSLDRPSQFGLGLSDTEAYAACGPAAAIAFARMFGRNPTAQEAVALARQVGWTPDRGMAGPQSEVELLKAMDVDAHFEGGVDIGKVASSVNGGSPVIVSTPGHYFTIDGYDPDTRSFHVGTSGTDLKGGSEWMTLDQMQARMGNAQGTIYLNQAPTSATSASGGPLEAAGHIKDAAAQKAANLASYLIQLGRTPSEGELSDFLASTKGAVADAADRAGSLLPDVTGTLTTQARSDSLAPVASGQPRSAIEQLSTLPAVYGGASQIEDQATTALDPLRDVPVVGGIVNATLNPLTGGPLGTLTAAGDAAKLGRAGLEAGLNLADRISPPEVAFASTLTGQDILNAALEQLGKYPSDVRAGIDSTVADLQRSGAAPSTIGATVQRWLAENPIEALTAAQPETTRLEPEIAAAIGEAPTLPPMSSDTVLQGLLNMARARGIDTSALEAQLASRQPGQITPQLAARAGGAAAGGLAGYNSDPNADAPTRIRNTAVGAGLGLGAELVGESVVNGVVTPNGWIVRPAQGPPLNFGEVFRQYRMGNLIAAPATVVKVAINSAVAPAWTLLRDSATLNLGRGGPATLAPEWASAFGSLGQAGAAFLDALTNGTANAAGGLPTTISQRVAPGAARVLARAWEMPGNIHGAMQAFASTIVQQAEMGRLAGLDASQRGLQPFSQAWWQHVQNVLATQPLQGGLLNEATAAASRASLRGELGTIGSGVNAAAHRMGPLGQILMPIVRIPINDLTQTLEKSPIGLIGTGVDVARAAVGQGPYTGAAGFAGNGVVAPLAERLANNVVGSAVTAFMVSKAMDGNITGDGPKEPAQRSLLMKQGWQPNSVNVPGVGWVSYESAPPGIKEALLITGNYADTQRYEHNETAQDEAASMLQRLAGQFATTPGLQSAGQVYELLRGGQNVERTAANFGASLADSVVPGGAFTKAIATATDPLARAVPNEDLPSMTLDTLKQDVPGLREQVRPATDLLGQPAENPQQGLGILLPHIRPGGASLTGKLLGQSGVTLAAAPKQLVVAGNIVPLTPDEQQLYERARGQVLEQIAPHLLDNAAFQRAPVKTRVQVLQQQIARADEVAKARTLAAVGGPEITARIGTSLGQPTFRPDLSLGSPANVSRQTPAAAAPALSMRDRLEAARQMIISDPQFADLSADQQDELAQQLAMSSR